MNRFFLDKADANTPHLFEREVLTNKTVRIISDEKTFFGARAEDAGIVPAVCTTGDVFTLDFGEHCVGYLSFRFRHHKMFLDAPVRLRLRFA